MFGVWRFDDVIKGLARDRRAHFSKKETKAEGRRQKLEKELTTTMMLHLSCCQQIDNNGNLQVHCYWGR